MDYRSATRTRRSVMAIKQKQPAPIPMIKDYIPALKRSMLAAVILPGVIVSITCALILLMTHALSADNIALWMVALVAGILSSGGSMLIFVYATLPMNDLLRAIAHVSGEPLAGAVPNPHDKKYAKSGLGTAIQTIYSLDSAESVSTTTKTSRKAANAMTSIDRMHGAIIALAADRTVLYASKDAPLHTVDGALQPQLLFNGSDSLDAWLMECETSSVKAERHWRRIPDRPSDQEEQRIFDIYASYEKDSSHETVLTLIDMTESYRADEEDLNFIAFAAHELRGPITVIRGYLDVLQDELSDVLADDQRELFYRLSVSANRLSSYVNNILNASRYDRRHLNLTLIAENIADIYATIADDMTLRANSQNRFLTVTIPQDLPSIAADRGSLSEVIGNIIDNAIKYSNEGGTVTVSAALRGDFVEVSVEDHGIGMPPNVTKNLFQKFYRSHRSRETVAGSGIGLYISKAIIESHGGTISVRSVEGEGSTFVIAIPTYASVAEKLTNDGSNQHLISEGKGWIKNHSMYRG